MPKLGLVIHLILRIRFIWVIMMQHIKYLPSSYEKIAIAGTFYMRFTQPYKINEDFIFFMN